MKFIVFCICVLGFALSNLAYSEIKQAFKNDTSTTKSNLMTCFTKHNITMDDVSDKKIIIGAFAEPGNKEKIRKLGCAYACFLTTADLMEGSNIKESKVHARINQIGNITQVHNFARDCMNEVKDITEECEKSFSLLICAVKAIISEIKQAFKNEISNLKTCFTEHNVTAYDKYNQEEIITGVYAKPENKEKTRKLGCALACFLTKQDLMEGSNIKESKVHALINQTRIIDPLKDIFHKVARDCMKEAKNITKECEKIFSLYVCGLKAIHKLKHGEHKEHEEAEIQDNEEAE